LLDGSSTTYPNAIQFRAQASSIDGVTRFNADSQPNISLANPSQNSPKQPLRPPFLDSRHSTEFIAGKAFNSVQPKKEEKTIIILKRAAIAKLSLGAWTIVFFRGQPPLILFSGYGLIAFF
jgi:hypothetical protein